MQIIGSGKYTTAFFKDGFTYKILHENKKNQSNYTKLEKEFFLLKKLEATDLPIPSNISKITDDQKKICGLKYQYIDGVQFKNFRFNKNSREIFFESITNFFHKLHLTNYQFIDKKPTNISKEIYAKILKQNKEKISSKKFIQLNSKINNMSEVKASNFSLIHGDINDGNFILKTNGTISGVIDWSEHMLSDPAYDLAGVLVYFGKDVLDYILKHNKYSEEMQERINYYASMEFLFHL
tara:strand:- start:2921 stop:3634 length:714 start_codon:yes stop_codon:yes gene_type:complete